MYVVRHQHQAHTPTPGRAEMLGQRIATKRRVGIAEEGARVAVAALGDMVRMTGDDDAGRRAMES